jgi:hypothetical protein
VTVTGRDRLSPASWISTIVPAFPELAAGQRHLAAGPRRRGQLHGLLADDRVVVVIEQVGRADVGDGQVVAHRQHRPLGPAAGGQELLEQGALAVAAQLEQPRLDVACRALDERAHQQAGVSPPAGDVDDPEHLAADRVADGRAGAGDRVETLDEVLVPEDVRGSLLLQRGADPVGADELLGVAEARGQQDLVEVGVQRALAGAAVHDPRLGVRQDDAHPGVGQLPLQPVQHRLASLEQPAVGVDLRPVGELHLVDRHSPEAGATP